LGMVYIYRASDLSKLTSYIEEAKGIMKQGKVTSGKNGDGTYMYATISDRLEGYRNSYLNAKYEDMQTNGGVAAKIAGSILQFNDPEKYLSVMESAKKVTADDIMNAFTKYWCTDKCQWFAVVGPENASFTIAK
jgi:zinc protease